MHQDVQSLQIIVQVLVGLKLSGLHSRPASQSTLCSHKALDMDPRLRGDDGLINCARRLSGGDGLIYAR